MAEYKERAIDKINKVLDIFASYPDRIKVLWAAVGIENLDLLDTKTADDFLAAVERFGKMNMGEYVKEVLLSDAITYSDRCDAYYGDPSATALWFFYRKKPVMIMNIDA